MSRRPPSPLTPAERGRLRAMWSRLTVAAATLDPEAMRGVSGDVLGMRSPVDATAEAFTLFAFGRLAHAYVRGGVEYRLRAGEALRVVAQLCADLLYEAEKAAQPPPRQLPFRADIDG